MPVLVITRARILMHFWIDKTLNPLLVMSTYLKFAVILIDLDFITYFELRNQSVVTINNLPKV